MIKPFNFFRGIVKKSRVNTNNRLTRTPIRRIPVGFCAGVYCTQLILHYEGDMDIESVRSMLIDLTIRYRTCIYFTNLTLSNMEDFLNEHLDGTSTIRYA
jgi:hypothetical protein